MRMAARFLIFVALALVVSCQREARNPRPVSARNAILGATPPESTLVPGGAVPGENVSNPYAGNAYGISEGQILFSSFNCSGCHGGYGGGGMGPALNDNSWIYGGEPANIFESIRKGRPNGMPAWGARIPADKIWQLVAYVRSLSGEQPKTATPPRSDSIWPEPSSLQNKVRGETR